MTTPALRAEVEQAITAYLMTGGLWNPELANHDKVRDLLIDARDELSRLAAENAELLESNERRAALVSDLTTALNNRNAERDGLRREVEALRRSIKEAREAELFEDGFDPYPDGTSVDPRSYMDGRQDVLTEVDQRAAELLRGKGGNDG